jgi:hypothetical protein
MATVAETKHKAGRMLGVVRMLQALKAEHDALLQEAYDQAYADLDEEGYATWASTGEVPDAVMPHLAALMAFSVCTDLGVSAERYQAILAQRNVAMPNIRRLTTPAHESVDEPTDY